MKRALCLGLVFAVSVTLLSGCGEKKTSSSSNSSSSNSTNAKKIEEEQQSDYIVNIDDSFDSGIDLSETRETLSPEEADFRNLKWGMTKEEVVYAQGTGYREPDENTLYYTRVREEGYPADAEYTFEENKLVKGIFYITDNKEEKPVSVKDYNELADSLSARFGTPFLEDSVYTNDEDKTDSPEKQAELILQNKLQLRTAWELNGTELRVVLFRKSGALCIGLQYKYITE